MQLAKSDASGQTTTTSSTVAKAPPQNAAKAATQNAAKASKIPSRIPTTRKSQTAAKQDPNGDSKSNCCFLMMLMMVVALFGKSVTACPPHISQNESRVTRSQIHNTGRCINVITEYFYRSLM